jgi:NAD(P)-dependent dehydrogenase (short-subunit alcohol dehydrogenase family)/enoyl-CoA hydratase/carnithine racemase
MPLPRTRVRRSRRGGVVRLTLDTPGSAVNVFDDRMAADLCAGLWWARNAGVILLDSAKPGSFLNGASLLLASASSTPEKVRRASEPLRAAYSELAACAVPTIAVLEGNCFGCGLELVLCCAYRIAKDVYPVRFYMTELADYRLVPIFGGTQRLPRLVGKSSAARLLLDGETWGPREALAAGLLDAVYPPGGFDSSVEAFAAAQTRRPPRRRARREADLPARLDSSVPPTRRAVYAQCRRLINDTSRRPLDVGLAAELEASVRTVVADEAKQAVAFFFVRQMAQAASFGTAEPGAPGIVLCCDDPELDAIFRERFRGCTGREVRLRGVRRSPVARRPSDELLVYAPGGALAEGWCEVATPSNLTPEQLRPIARALRWIGFEAIATRPRRELVVDRLVGRWASEVEALLDRGVTPAELRGALWSAGFVRMPEDVLAMYRRGELLDRFADSGRVEASEALLAPLYDGLASEVRACVADGSLAHASQGDVLVQHLLEFPRERGSLLLRADRTSGAGFYSRGRGEAGRRVAVVTGAAGSLGRRVVERLGRAGLVVVATDLARNGAGLGDAYLQLDVSEARAVRDARDRILRRFGRIDALVNCAGRFSEGALLSAPDEELERSLAVNLAGVWHCVRAFGQVMTRQGSGRIVAVASLAAHRALPGAAAYAAAKGGLVSLIRTAAVELAPHGVSAICVVPGFIDSALTERWMGARADAWRARIPLRRFASSDEIAELIEFLVTSEGGYITGAELVIDGGYDAT